MEKLLRLLGVKIQIPKKVKKIMRDIIRIIAFVLVTYAILYLLGRLIQHFCLQLIISSIVILAIGSGVLYYHRKIFKSVFFQQSFIWVVFLFATLLYMALTIYPPGDIKHLKNNPYYWIPGLGSFLSVFPFMLVHAAESWLTIPSKYFAPLQVDNLNDVGIKVPPGARGIKWIFISTLPGIGSSYNFRLFRPEVPGKENIASFFKAHLAYHNRVTNPDRPILYKNVYWSFYADGDLQKMLNHHLTIEQNAVNGLKYKAPMPEELGKVRGQLPKDFKWAVIYVKQQKND